MAYERMLLDRFSRAPAYDAEWDKRNEFMLEVFQDTIGRKQTFSYSEYGCGPNRPFKSVVDNAEAGSVICYDFKVLDNGNKVVNLNAVDFAVEKTDVGVLSGVLEYLNNFEMTFKVLAKKHKYVLFSYSIFQLRLSLTKLIFLRKLIKDRCQMVGIIILTAPH